MPTLVITRVVYEWYCLTHSYLSLNIDGEPILQKQKAISIIELGE